MFVVIYSSKHNTQAQQILKLWERAGIPTFDTTRMQKADQFLIPLESGLMSQLSSLLNNRELQDNTIFSVARDKESTFQIIDMTTKYVGDWSREDVGVLFVRPLTYMDGLVKENGQAKEFR